MGLKKLIKEYMLNSTLHGAKFIVDDDNSTAEKLFWLICVIISWIASGMLISVSLDAFRNNAISFVVESSYRDWRTNFPAIVVCESKNMDRIQEIAEELWGMDHDFSLEEVLSEVAFFRGESYHTIHECGGDDPAENCFQTNFSHYAKLVRSDCKDTINECFWKDEQFDCCKYFQLMETELGICYALNSIQAKKLNTPALNMYSDKYTGPGSLRMEIMTEAHIYTLGEEDVPNLVTPKSDILTVGPYVSYTRLISIKNIENDEGTRDVSIAQRNCRFSDENNLDVHAFYSYSACSVQCRKDKQLAMCNCISHLIPNTPESIHCNMTGLQCLNDHYEDLSVVVASWSHANGRKGLVCDCLPSCTEVDISVVHDIRDNIYGHQRPISKVEIGLVALPTERYKRNVVRGKLDLVVSMGGTTGLFVGASLLSFVEILYYFTIRPYGTIFAQKKKNESETPTDSNDNNADDSNTDQYKPQSLHISPLERAKHELKKRAKMRPERNPIKTKREQNARLYKLTCLLIIIGVALAQYQNIAVVENDAMERTLPDFLRNPFYRTPRIREALAYHSWLGPGEQFVFDRQSEKIPRWEIYNVLSHAGLVKRRPNFQ